MKLKLAAILPHPPIVVPEIGKDEVNKIPETFKSFEKIADLVSEIKPQTIIMISSHNAMYYDYFNIAKGKEAFGSFKKFNADVNITVKYNEDLVNEIIRISKLNNIPLGTEGTMSLLDHGTMVPLYFINKKYTDYKLVRIGISGLDNKTHYEVGKIINEAINNFDEDVVVITSGDMSHKLKADGPYGISKEGIEYDKKVVSLLKESNFKKLLDFDETFLSKAAECGHRCFVMLGGILDGYTYKGKFLSYENVFGIGYGAFTYEVIDEYVQLAIDTINEYVNNKKIIEIPGYISKELLNNKAGVFVTIYKNNHLRGCIGTIEPYRENIALEIIHNAISSCSRDPRFNPVDKSELSQLKISVDVLNKAEKVESIKELDVKKYGVIVSYRNRRGLLLPNIDGVNTVEAQINIALNKAGIDVDDEYSIERFKVIRHEM
ncbi:MAG: AmmeMemoRadiSam system protein A [Erysipelotrichaceae bacterium]|nr:AmmeMemoRadiSam system protein A [Erysipelotrichaceae bacterium]